MLRKSVKKLTPVEETVRVATPVMVNGRKHQLLQQQHPVSPRLGICWGICG